MFSSLIYSFKFFELTKRSAATAFGGNNAFMMLKAAEKKQQHQPNQQQRSKFEQNEFESDVTSQDPWQFKYEYVVQCIGIVSL